MSTKAHHSRSFFGGLFPAISRDYLARRRRTRNLTNFVLIAVLSLLLAGVIVYTSNPGSFSSIGK